MALHRFGTISDVPVTEVTLALASGATASILDFGAIVRDLQIPDPDGGRRRVVLGYRDLAGYLADRAYLGAIVGRYANRIAGGRFELGGRVHQLSRNDHDRTHLHGGICGFNRRHWTIVGHDDASVTMMLTSPAGEEGYPGKVEVTCTYRLAPPATLLIEMQATTDASTIVNLVHHSYFNLNYCHSIRDHLLQVNASNYTPTTQDLIPTGDIVPVRGTRYDFRVPRPLETASIGADFLYDINFAIDRSAIGLSWAATIAAPSGGLWMEVHTSEPGLQLYDGGHLTPSEEGLDGRFHFRHAGLCLEPGRFPDAPNHTNFPSAILDPGAAYRQRTEYRFGRGPVNWVIPTEPD
jgi:aldose 1-epimerase